MNPMTPPIEEQQEVARELDSSCNHHQQSMNASSHEEFYSSSSFRGNKHALCVVGIGAGSSSRPPNEFTRDATGPKEIYQLVDQYNSAASLRLSLLRGAAIWPSHQTLSGLAREKRK
ncbi:hypothetical protein GW17_00044292 [Ensete ventricosum]|uniref:Uncharacterized protein n=1 Tax=Ensete ventricosum TaxID=4639 RepID=A0A444D548_ENSVE|nr:hypothetical protein GW17_00044292 [Ensete ventricosum]RZR73307.1 hypothetical protein BHM03_00022607 [Ensete ventricosum]